MNMHAMKCTEVRPLWEANVWFYRFFKANDKEGPWYKSS